ncbi:MAG: S1C family serine protease [Egibacteraceae bacterium]
MPASPEAVALDAYSQVVTRVAKTLTASVASLDVRRRMGGHLRRAGAGSAVALTPDGFLATSAHVVQGAEGGTAGFANGIELSFEVVGIDPLSDLAVVRVGGDLVPATLGDADQLQVGQLVVAVGNPLGYAGSVSAGVVSALGRSLTSHHQRSSRLIENVIQTDAALHPGNSGGALADSAARVVGVNTALIGLGVGQGLGMAVPINATTRQILAALMRDGRVRRAYLGIAGGSRPLPPRAVHSTARQRGIEILSIVEGSPAAAAGLRPEDIVVTIDGMPTERVGALQQLMTDQRIGKPVLIEYVRGGRLARTHAIPIELPD